MQIKMVQTRIDQFYKVIRSNQKSTNKKDIKKSFSNESPVTKRKGKQLSYKLKTFSVHKNIIQKARKVNRKEKMQNISLNNEVYCLSRTDGKNSPTKIMAAKSTILPAINYTSPISNQKHTPEINTPASNRTSKFSPKTPSPLKNALDESRRYAKLTRRKLFEDRNEELLSKMIKNLNLAKEGAIANNDINLEKVYLSGKFSYKYNPIDTTTSMRYEINDVIRPADTYALHFFLTIITVFSNPINCGYFDEYELDFIFSLLTLSKSAQALLIRMLKRKHTWHRISKIKYDQISNNLTPIFDELVSRSFFTSSMKEEDISVLLDLLQVEEIRKICQESKMKCNKKKKDNIQSILKFLNKTKSLFPGITSPATKLCATINKHLGICVLLNPRIKQLIDKIIMLLIPNRDPTKSLNDIFRMIQEVETHEIKFPEVTISEFPIFANKEHLLQYIEAKNTLSDILNAIKMKQWDVVRNLGSLATERLSLFLKVETQSLQYSTLPHHIRCFMPGYLWLKILYKSIDAFKKTKETMPKAIKSLQILLKQDCHMKSRKGSWFIELIKIKMHHMKNFDDSVALLLKAVSHGNLTEVDRLDLLDRAEMVVKRRTAISNSIKATVRHILDNDLNKAQLTSQICSITIEGMLCRNTLQKKSTWCINKTIDEQTFGSVESFALYHYKSKGYPKGVHCEGAFPITLFSTLFWEEIYNMNIPGTCVSLYQEAPLDLYSSEFYENRKERIDARLRIIRTFDSETLSKHIKEKFDLYREYKSLGQGTLFDNSDSFQEVTFCLGVEGIVGICERLIHDFRLWRAGFPDLIVWNACTKQYKIVEVKGPNDSLSTKQKLWLDYLNNLGLNTEVCYCKPNTSYTKGGRKRKHDEITT